MIGIGTALNTLAILLGGTAGLLAKSDLATRRQLALRKLLGLLVVFAGFQMIWTGLAMGGLGRGVLQIVIALVATSLGRLIGSALGIQDALNRLGSYANKQFSGATTAPERDDVDGASGFVTATILFCVGPMAILGSIQEGLGGPFTTLAVKSLMDGLAAFAFARIFGASVLFAALPVLVYQGTLTLFAGLLKPHLEQEAVLASIHVTGGLLVLCTVLIVFNIKKVKLADYLPALVVAPLLAKLL